MGAVHARLRIRSQRLNVIESAQPGRALRPRDAATLILVERSERGRARVLMGKRHARHKFMPGKFVFPGGRVEPEDRRMGAAGVLDPHVEEKLNARVRRPSPQLRASAGAGRDPRNLRGDGSRDRRLRLGAPENPPPGAWTRFAATGVHPALDAIDFLARAITPPGRSRRFDARFLIVDARFVARRIDGAVHPEAELVELVWTPLERSAEPRPSRRSPARRSTTLPKRSKAAWTNAGHDPSIARSAANGCASSCKAGLGAAPQAANRTGGNRPASSIRAR